jgi:hypothetical protein
VACLSLFLSLSLSVWWVVGGRWLSVSLSPSLSLSRLVCLCVSASPFSLVYPLRLAGDEAGKKAKVVVFRRLVARRKSFIILTRPICWLKAPSLCPLAVARCNSSRGQTCLITGAGSICKTLLSPSAGSSSAGGGSGGEGDGGGQDGL